MRRNRRGPVGAAWLVFCLLCPALPAQAQPAPAASQNAPSERAQRDADKVFQWIRLHADKPRRARDEKEVQPAAVVRPAKAVRPATPLEPPAPSEPPAATPAPLETPRVDPVAAAPVAVAPASPLEPEEDDPLVFVHQVEPDFPRLAMRSLRKGSVRVRFEVKPDGTIGRTEVVKTSNGRLNEAAVAAVAQWRFQPLRHAQAGFVDLEFNLD